MGLNSAGWSYGPPIEDFGCITSHAQSTAATYFTGAVKSDVVHLIVVCLAFLLQSFGAEQILHTRWPTEIFAHACVEIKSMSTDFMCIPSRNKAFIAATSFARRNCSGFLQLIMVRWCGGLGADTVLGGPKNPPWKTLALLHHMHRAQLPRISSVRSNLTLFIAS